MKKLAAFLLSLLVTTLVVAQAGRGVEGTGVEGPGVECGTVYGPPCTSGSSSVFAIITQGGTAITTEAGQTLFTQAAP